MAVPGTAVLYCTVPNTIKFDQIERNRQKHGFLLDDGGDHINDGRAADVPALPGTARARGRRRRRRRGPGAEQDRAAAAAHARAASRALGEQRQGESQFPPLTRPLPRQSFSLCSSCVAALRIVQEERAETNARALVPANFR